MKGNSFFPFGGHNGIHNIVNHTKDSAVYGKALIWGHSYNERSMTRCEPGLAFCLHMRTCGLYSYHELKANVHEKCSFSYTFQP
jgi:hypothetical protein